MIRETWRRLGPARGYSLVELLVVLAVSSAILAALFGVHRASLEVHARATALEDAQLGARAGLDRMTTELRLVGAYWAGAARAGPAIIAADRRSIAFMADVNGDSARGDAETTTVTAAVAGSTTVSVTGPARHVADAFDVYANRALNDFVSIASGATREVRQLVAVAGTTLTLAAPLDASYPAGSVVRSVERVTYRFDPATGKLTRSVGGSGADTIVDGVVDLAITYFDGRNPPAVVADADRIREIDVRLTTARDGRQRTMTSRVRIRN